MLYRRWESPIISILPFALKLSSKQGHSIWKLPNDYTLPGETPEPVEVIPVEEEEYVAEEEGVELAPVEGFTNWKKVDRGDDPPYYFHVITQETRWEFPVSN